jgi:Arc/MetJ-type ribon-helix-helix transcriptional regulator
MSMLTRRLQVLLDEQQYRRLESVAKRRRVSVSTVVRDAIERDLMSGADARRYEAAQRFLASPDMVVDELLAELDALRGRRG